MTYPPQPPGYGQPYGQQPPVVSGPPAQPYAHPQPAGFYPPPPPPKKSNTGKIILGIVGGLLGLCVLGSVISAVAGSDSTTVTPPKAKAGGTQPADKAAAEPAEKEAPENSTFDVPIGSTLTLDSGGDVQEWTLTSAKYRKSCGGLGEAKEGGFLIVDVKMIQKEGTGSVNPLFFNYVSNDGTTQNSISGAFSGCEKNTLDSTNSLRAGQRRSGQLVFDVASPKGSVELTPGLGADTAGSWKLK